jgi:hypothetical protein
MGNGPSAGLRRWGRHFTADTRGVSHSAGTTKFSREWKVPPYSYGDNVPHAVQTLVRIRDLIFSIQHGGNTHFSRGEILISARRKYSLTARPKAGLSFRSETAPVLSITGAVIPMRHAGKLLAPESTRLAASLSHSRRLGQRPDGVLQKIRLDTQ